MTFETTLRYLGIWSAVGCAIFSVYVVAAFRTGIVYTARKEDGTLKKRIPLSGCLNMLIVLLSIVGFQVAANYFGLAGQSITIGFVSLFLLNFGHYLILFTFDEVVVDGLVLGVWRPKFLKLSDAMGRESMRKHMLLSIPVGTVAGLGLTAMSTTLSYFALFSG